MVGGTHRYYDPEAGRWLTRDPIRHAGGLNLYEYCGGDPVGGVDASGLAVKRYGAWRVTGPGGVNVLCVDGAKELTFTQAVGRRVDKRQDTALGAVSLLEGLMGNRRRRRTDIHIVEERTIWTWSDEVAEAVSRALDHLAESAMPRTTIKGISPVCVTYGGAQHAMAVACQFVVDALARGAEVASMPLVTRRWPGARAQVFLTAMEDCLTIIAAVGSDAGGQCMGGCCVWRYSDEGFGVAVTLRDDLHLRP